MNLFDLNVGDQLPQRQHVATNVSLFLYNAAVWNAHRIHYDESYTKNVEKHQDIIIDGPLQGDWLSQCALNWLGEMGDMVSFNYSNRKVAYLGEVLTTGGSVVAIDDLSNIITIELFVKNESGEVITPGGARLRVFS